jgi:hypothetical protein
MDVLLKAKQSYINLSQIIDEDNSLQKMDSYTVHSYSEKLKTLDDYFKILMVFEILYNWINDSMHEQKKKEQIVSYYKIGISYMVNDQLENLVCYFNKFINDIFFMEKGYINQDNNDIGVPCNIITKCSCYYNWFTSGEEWYSEQYKCSYHDEQTTSTILSMNQDIANYSDNLMDIIHFSYIPIEIENIQS